MNTMLVCSPIWNRTRPTALKERGNTSCLLQENICAPGGGRTHDSRIKGPLLYQLSYKRKFVGAIGFEPTQPMALVLQTSLSLQRQRTPICDLGGIRTHVSLIKSQVRKPLRIRSQFGYFSQRYRKCLNSFSRQRGIRTPIANGEGFTDL